MLPSLQIGRVVIRFYKRVSCLSPCSRIKAQDRFISDICRKISSESTDCYLGEKKRQSDSLWNSPNTGDDCNNDVQKHGSRTISNCLNGSANWDVNLKTDCVQYDSFNGKEIVVDACCCWKGTVITRNAFNSDSNHLVLSDYCETNFKSNYTGVFYLNKPFSQNLFHNAKICFAEQRHKSFLITNIENKDKLFSKTDQFHTQVCRHYSGLTTCNYIYSHTNSSFKRNTVNKVTLRNISKKDYKFPDFNEEDISETFQRGDGPGGQATAKTNNCCILTHHPTGIVIRCHETRVLEKNRAKAREKLREQLDVYYNGENSFLALQQKEGIEHRSKKRDRSRKRLEMKKAWKENIQKDINTEKDEKD